MEENEFYKESFVGKKFEKIYNSKFSWATFFFGTWHWAYRKMVLEAFCLLILKTLLGILFSTTLGKILVPLISNRFLNFTDMVRDLLVSIVMVIIVISIVNIVIGIISGFLFVPVYKKFVDRKVKKIIDKDANDSELEEMKTCEKKGGTSVLYLIIFIILSSVITGRVYNTKELSNTAEDLDLIQNPLDNSGYNGSINYKTDIDLSDYIELEIPDGFSKDDELYEEYKYTYTIDDSDATGFNSCDFSIGIVEDYISSEKLIREISEAFNVENNTYSLEINNITWNIIGRDNESTDITYYNATSINGKVILFEYEIGYDIEKKDKYDEYYKDILTSIILVDGSKSSDSEIKAIREKINVFSGSTEDSSTKKASRSDGYFEYNQNTKAEIENIKYDIPDVFSLVSETDSRVRYSSETEDKLEFSILGVKSESAEQFIKDAEKANKNYIVEDSYSVELNDLNWNIIAFLIDGNYIYYNAFDYNDNVYLFRYIISENITDEKFTQTYEQIILSIRIEEPEEVTRELSVKAEKKVLSAEEIKELFEIYNKDEISGSEINECISEAISKNENDLPEDEEIAVIINFVSGYNSSMKIRKEYDITNYLKISTFQNAKFKCSNMEYNKETGYLNSITFDELE